MMTAMNHRSPFSRASEAAFPRKPKRVVLGCAFVLATSGCYTTSNVVTMGQLRTKYPVSASGQYVDASGTVVTENEYEVVKPFEFERSIEAERHEDTETELKLQPALDEFLAQAQGDAVTDMKIYATEYDTGSHGSSAGWKIMGWSFGLTGATFLVTGAAVGDEMGGTFMTLGAVFAGVGLGSYLLGLTANDPTAWKLHVTGNVVKRNAGSAPPTDLHPGQPVPSQPAADSAGPAPAVPGQPVPAPLE